MVDLDSFRDDLYEVPDDDEQRQHWRVEDERMAIWAQRKLARARAELDRIADVAAEEIATINAWAEEASRPAERDAAYFEGLLEDYLRRELHEQLLPLMDEGVTLEEAWDRLAKKSINLPGGRLQARIVKETVTIVDEEAFVAWAREHRLDLVRFAPPKKSDLRSAVHIREGNVYTADGEAVPGTVVEPARISFSV